jgi:hypothetical protein
MVRSRKLKKRIKIINHLNPLTPEELSKDKGMRLNETQRRPNKKKRRHDGRVFPYVFYPQKLLDEEEIPINNYYDPWTEYKDGFRETKDRTKLRKSKGSYFRDPEDIKKWNKKIMKEIIIKNMRKLKKIMGFKPLTTS